jgi:hypothetical protein
MAGAQAAVWEAVDGFTGSNPVRASIAAVPAQSSWWMPNAMANPSVVAIPTSLPPCS